MQEKTSMRVKAQQFGGKLSSMILPNLGAFMGWGILTALGIHLNNEMFSSFIGPMLNYFLPIVIAYAGGQMVYKTKGAVVGSFATMGVILGADTTMLLGAMIMGPLTAYFLKKLDEAIEEKIPVGFELLIGNLTVAIIGVIFATIGITLIAPAIISLSGVFSAGVEALENNNLLPLTAFFIEPAKVLFLNNAIGQGVLTPLGSTQLAEHGKSVLFLLESNPGPGLGVLLAFIFFGKGTAKANAYGATVIHLFGGIHEIYFPYILMKPTLILAAISGGITGTFIFSMLDVGLVGVSSPGSIITILMMAAAGDHLKILLGILGATAVSFLVATLILKFTKNTTDDAQLVDATTKMENLKGKKSKISGVFKQDESVDEIPKENNQIDKKSRSDIKIIRYVCDAGMGSSALGASVLRKKLKQSGLSDIDVPHTKIMDLPMESDIIITHESLKDAVMKKQSNIEIVTINDYLNAPEYDELVEQIKSSQL